jgi:hypothetical protein
VTDNTKVRAYLQYEQISSRMSNSQQFGQPDWRGTSTDSFGTLGLGLTQLTMKGKLELSGDLTISRGHNDTTIWFGSFGTQFPTIKTALDSLTLSAVWHQTAKLDLLGSLAYEHYGSDDWHLDGVAPGTVPNLLAYGEQAPHYNVGVIRLAARYRF